jgi:hypothetical protein
VFNGWYGRDDVTWSDLHDDWIPDDNLVELHDGTYTHDRNYDVHELHDGRCALADDCVKRHDGSYALTDDCVQLHDGSYALADDCTELDDGTHVLTSEQSD